jgi:hypothetical protein
VRAGGRRRRAQIKLVVPGSRTSAAATTVDAAAVADADEAEVVAVVADEVKATVQVVLAPTLASIAIRMGIGRENVPSRAVMEQSVAAGEEIGVDAAAETVEEVVAAETKLGSMRDTKRVPSSLSVKKTVLCFWLTAFLSWNRARLCSITWHSTSSSLSRVRVPTWGQMMKKSMVAGTWTPKQHTT